MAQRHVIWKAIAVILEEQGRTSEPLCTTNAANRRGGACISCRGGSELADAGAERGEDGRGRDASGLGEVIAVGAGHLVDQAVGTQQAEFATEIGRAHV